MYASSARRTARRTAWRSALYGTLQVKELYTLLHENYVEDGAAACN